MSPSILLTGGARSGKSTLAVALATRWRQPVTFIATATPGDADMAARIERHRAERPAGWHTVEEPRHVADAVAGCTPDQVLVLDCLTLWVTNCILTGESLTEIERSADSLAAQLAARPAPVVAITNEVGSGVVPPTETGRQFRDVLGTVNRVFAGHFDRVCLVAAGRVTELQPPTALFPELHPDDS